MPEPSPDEQRPLIAVVGPTASGKTALSVELARRLAHQGAAGEIINADSMQLYRGMDIGTAKAELAERRGVPHHLIDLLDISQDASAAAYQQQAREAIAEIRGRGGTPILVGGSGLYIRAALDVVDFPPTDPALRAELTQRLQDRGAVQLREQLGAVDPESAAVIRDDRRLVRALEVITLTGRPFSSYMPQRVYEPTVEPVVQLGLAVPRTLLHRRIARRVETMVQQGLLEEVHRLAQAGLRGSSTASRAIGYQQFLRVLDAELDEEEAAEATVVATRRFARRQETWFRADPRIRWLDVDEETSAAELTVEALAAMRQASPGS